MRCASRCRGLRFTSRAPSQILQVACSTIGITPCDPEATMRLEKSLPWTAPLFVLLLLPGCDKSPTPPEPAVESSQEAAATLENSIHGEPFDIALVFFEFNTTDNDLGFQVFL